MRWIAVVAVTLVAVAACDTPGESDSTPPATGAVEANAVVELVIDGDTVDLVIDGREERVRLIGIDTPETFPEDEVECFGPEASAYVETLIPVGTPVRIERDTVNRDDYGRLLGYVYRADDGAFVNYEIVRQGYATPLSIAPNTTYESLFVAAALDAEADDAGLWAACRE